MPLNIPWSTLGKHTRKFAGKATLAIQWLLSVICIGCLTILSIYGLWGWLTLCDFRSYCIKHSLDYYKVLDQLVNDPNIKYTVEGGNTSFDVVNSDTLDPLYRFTIPFSLSKVKKSPDGSKIEDIQYTQGAILAPFMGITESTSNGLFTLCIGYLIGVSIVISRSLSGSQIGLRFCVLRPVLAASSALITYIIVFSGGAVIWNQVAGVSGLSLGVIAAVGAIFSEKLSKLITTTF